MDIQALSKSLRSQGVAHTIVIAGIVDVASLMEAWTPLLEDKKYFVASGPTKQGLRKFRETFSGTKTDIPETIKQIEYDQRNQENARWHRFVDAYTKQFGRKPDAGDWQISGVGCDKLGSDVKEELRNITEKITRLQKAEHVLVALKKLRNF